MQTRFEGWLIINRGSAGLPFETIDGHTHYPCGAEYALIGRHMGDLQVDFRRVPVDLAELTAAVQASSMPHAGWWLKRWR